MEPQSSTYEVHKNPTSPAVKMPCKEACGMHTQVAAFVLKKKRRKKRCPPALKAYGRVWKPMKVPILMSF